MGLNNNEREIIDTIANIVIDACDITIPIKNIKEVVIKLGGEIKEDEDLSGYSDGFVRKIGVESFEIVVSPYQKTSRLNFTIAHEIGHLFLHMGYIIDQHKWESQKERCYYRLGETKEEYEANEFAASLLMPKEMYKQALYKYSDGESVDINKVAEEFCVSPSAAANRGRWLGYLEW